MEEKISVYVFVLKNVLWNIKLIKLEVERKWSWGQKYTIQHENVQSSFLFLFDCNKKTCRWKLLTEIWVSFKSFCTMTHDSKKIMKKNSRKLIRKKITRTEKDGAVQKICHLFLRTSDVPLTSFSPKGTVNLPSNYLKSDLTIWLSFLFDWFSNFFKKTISDFIEVFFIIYFFPLLSQSRYFFSEKPRTSKLIHHNLVIQQKLCHLVTWIFQHPITFSNNLRFFTSQTA